MFGINPKLIADEVSRKKDEYSRNEEISTISKLCQLEQIEFRVEVHAGPTPKVIAMKAAKTLKPTWLILDRQMKKDQAYFTEKLSCGISRIKRDNTIEELRQPKPKMSHKKAAAKGSEDNTRSGQVTYDEMIPGSPENGKLRKEEEDRHRNHKKSALAMSSLDEPSTPPVTSTTARLFYESSCSGTSGPKRDSTDPEEEEKSKPAASVNEIQEEVQKHADDTANQKTEGNSPKEEEAFRNSICSICKNERPRTEWKRDFTYSELHSATEGFSVKNFLSEGGFGSVYKGDINGMKVAVKQHKSVSLQGEKEFKSEVMVLKRVRHENLVTLLGSCAEGSHRLLVYEYVCNGSLDQHLSKHTRKPLSWEMRMKIAIGAAKGLQYLHENNIIHRDMRPSNILITHDYESMLGDFGLARTQQEDQELSTETNVVGTLGYLAPEYAEYGKVSTKTDVYSFGIVLLQLITGLKTTDKKLGGKSLVGWARPLLKEKNYPDLIDQRILDTHDVHQLFWMVRVAEKCLSKDPKKRLSMEKVVCALDHIIESETGCSSIKDYSPVPSDTISSTRGSSDSREDDDDDDDTGGSTVDTVSTSGTSSIASLTLFPPLQSSATIRNPPTPPMQTTSAPQDHEYWYEI
ncbi:Proline-rich receptor-like protein kinase PERK8 [Linum grandiflorum]